MICPKQAPERIVGSIPRRTLDCFPGVASDAPSASGIARHQYSGIRIPRSAIHLLWRDEWSALNERQSGSWARYLAERWVVSGRRTCPPKPWRRRKRRALRVRGYSPPIFRNPPKPWRRRKRRIPRYLGSLRSISCSSSHLPNSHSTTPMPLPGLLCSLFQIPDSPFRSPPLSPRFRYPTSFFIDGRSKSLE